MNPIILLRKQMDETSFQSGYKSKIDQINNLLGQIIKQLKQMNGNNNYDQIQKLFRDYIPISSLNIHTLRRSSKASLKLYKESAYFGEFEEEKRHGKGIMIYQNGRVYQGEWINNQKNGNGFEKFSNDAKYSGEYKDGKPSGYGIYIWANGEQYEGEWKQGHKHGKGLWKGSEGDYYDGEWKLGKVDGQGTHVWLTGDKYQGGWNDCLKHGFGREQFCNGDLYVGNYCKGKPSGYGEYYWKNGSCFKGNFKDGLRHGKGIWTKIGQHSDRYEGMYANDKKCGYGVFTWANGNVYKGSYFDDNRHGYGQMYWKQKCCYKGHWQNGVQLQQNKTIILQEETVSEDIQQSIKDFGSKTYYANKNKDKTSASKQLNKTTGNFKTFKNQDIINSSKLNNLLFQKQDELKFTKPQKNQVKRRKINTHKDSDWFSIKTKLKLSNRSSIGNTKKLKSTANISELLNTFQKPVRHKTAASKTDIKVKSINTTFNLAKSLQSHVHCQEPASYDEVDQSRIPHSSFYLYRMSSNQKGRSFYGNSLANDFQRKSIELNSDKQSRPATKSFKRKYVIEQRKKNINIGKSYGHRHYSFSLKH